MNILHILSHSSQITGSWFYARALTQYSQNLGHKVYLCADSLQIDFPCPFIPLPIANRSLGNRLRNIHELIKIIQLYQIDMVHAHARSGSWVAYFATRATGIPLVSSLHMLQHVHTSTYYNIYGDYQIAVSHYIKEQAVNSLHYNPEKIAVIPNGIDFSEIAYNGHGLENGLAIIGRTSGYKGVTIKKLVQNALEAVLREFPAMQVYFAGGSISDLGADTANYLAMLNRKYNNRIHDLGFVRPLGEVFNKVSVVIGAGRVAIEALYSKIPLLVVGEAGYLGRIRKDNFEVAVKTNFADLCPPLSTPITPEQLLADLYEVKQQADFSEKIAELYGVEPVGRKVHQVYEQITEQKHHSCHVIRSHRIAPR